MLDEPEVMTLQFRAQADGRKVGRLSSGKVVLIDLLDIDRVKDGEWWVVRLRHRETFAVATPVEKAPAPVTSAPPAAASSPAMPASLPAPPGPAASSMTKVDRVVPGIVGGMLIEPHDIVKPTDRVAFFVDGANMDGACRLAGYFVDYHKARDYFLGLGSFYAGFFYVADFSGQDPLQQKFLDFLSYAGYIIRKKPVKTMTDSETGERIYKGNLDTEIVLDMLNTVVNYDVAFLFSGDSDFERAVDLLRSRGKRVYVVTSKRSISRELAYVADKPVFFLEDFRTMLARNDKAGV